MPPEPISTSDAEQLDTLWDDFTAYPDQMRFRPSQDEAGDLRDEAIIALLQSLSPVETPLTKARVRAQIELAIDKEMAMPAFASATPLKSQAPTPPPYLQRLKRRPEQRTINRRSIERLVAALLVLSLLGSYFGIGPGRSWITPDSRSTIEALPGFANQPEEKPGEGSMVRIELDPSTAPYSPIEVGVWDAYPSRRHGHSAPPFELIWLITIRLLRHLGHRGSRIAWSGKIRWRG